MKSKFILTCFLLCFLLACQPDVPTTITPDQSSVSDLEATISKLPPVQINLQEINPTDLQSEIERHTGKVVLVDFWALWCPTCLESFHHLSKWYLKYAEKGLVVITVNLDEDNAENRQKVTAYLQKQRAPFETFICRAGATKDAMQTFKIDGEALPHCQIYSREGKHVISLGNYDPDRLYDEPSINRVLEKQLSPTQVSASKK